MTGEPSAGPALARGVVSGEPDLWCTYAAVRTLAWLDRLDRVANPADTAAYLMSRQNADGGYAWSKGMPSDAWAVFYCTQALRDLGRPVAKIHRTADWLRQTWSGDAFAMMPGQEPDIWATHFSVRTSIDVCGADVPDRIRLLEWLRALQSPSGGLTWSPAHARSGEADVRACYYGIAAWRALTTVEPVDPPWDVTALVAWLRDQQVAEGGFRFGPEATVPCMWATYRATAALNALDAAPARSAVDWIHRLRGRSGGFVRWSGYQTEDVWASFCAVGSLRAMGVSPNGIADEVATRIGEFALANGGYSYREPPNAADALTTAARVLSTDLVGSARVSALRWLENCQLPNEGGVMYMPGRGSEVRCTLWALSAGAFADSQGGRDRIARWLREIQNPDGGFGYWEGRGSDMVSTAAATAATTLLGRSLDTTMNAGALAEFVGRCAREGGPDTGYGNVPGAPATLRASLQALRIRHALGTPDGAAVADVLRRHRVSGGGYANEGCRIPDLLSTYEAVLTADTYGIPVDADHLSAFMSRISTPVGTAWTPLAPAGSGALADCLGELLRRRCVEPLFLLPPLTLS